jgi:hypothetical protein
MAFFLKVLAGGKIAKMFGGPKSAGKEDSGSRTTRQLLAEETKKLPSLRLSFILVLGIRIRIDPKPFAGLIQN